MSPPPSPHISLLLHWLLVCTSLGLVGASLKIKITDKKLKKLEMDYLEMKVRAVLCAPWVCPVLCPVGCTVRWAAPCP